jgi:hypothetical protein
MYFCVSLSGAEGNDEAKRVIGYFVRSPWYLECCQSKGKS